MTSCTGGNRIGRIDYPPLFIDTSAWIALNQKKDSHHERAKTFVETNKGGDVAYGPIHTSEMVLQETYTFLLYNYNHGAAKEIVEKILRSNVIIHPFNSQDFSGIWNRITERKSMLSFVDWSIVALMERYSIGHIFTFDGDFTRLGFMKVP